MSQYNFKVALIAYACIALAVHALSFAIPEMLRALGCDGRFPLFISKLHRLRRLTTIPATVALVAAYASYLI